MHGTALNHDCATEGYGAIHDLAGRKILFTHTIVVAERLVREYLPSVAARDHLQGSRLHWCIDQWNPEVDHKRIVRLALQQSQILVPRHYGLILIWELCA